MILQKHRGASNQKSSILRRQAVTPSPKPSKYEILVLLMDLIYLQLPLPWRLLQRNQRLSRNLSLPLVQRSPI